MLVGAVCLGLPEASVPDEQQAWLEPWVQQRLVQHSPCDCLGQQHTQAGCELQTGLYWGGRRAELGYLLLLHSV